MIYTLGETLLDIIFDNNGQTTATPGGAMLNVSVSLARMNIHVSLVSELGDDETGNRIISFLKNNGVNTNLINSYHRVNTSLALAYLDEEAKPAYHFYKTYPKDRSLVKNIVFTASDFLLFGSVYSLDPAVRNDIVTLVEAAKRQEAVVVYDPNIRHAHHLSDVRLRRAVTENMAMADVVKGSDEDFTNIFGKGTPDVWAEKIKKINPAAVVVVTMGVKGAVAFADNQSVFCAAQKVKVVSTVGAGDAFSAGLLYKLNRYQQKPAALPIEIWSEILQEATRRAASVCALKENYISR